MTVSSPPDTAHSVDPTRLREVAGSYASGVTVVTARGPRGPLGMTVQAFHSLSLDPPMVLICIGRRSRSWPTMAAAGYVGVNVLAADQAGLANRFAKPVADRFAGLDCRPHPVGGVPVLPGALATIVVRLGPVIDGGDHWIALGDVVALDARPEGEPLIYFRSRLTSIDREEAR